jgi:hypothetical protein
MSVSFLNHFMVLAPFKDMKDVTYRKALNSTQISDILRMCREQPVIDSSMRTFQDVMFTEPFEIIMGAANEVNKESQSDTSLFSLKPEIRATIISKHWMSWCRQVDTLTNQVGFAPFYFKSIRHQVQVEELDEFFEDTGDVNELVATKKKQVLKEVIFQFPQSPTLDMGEVEIFLYDKEPHLIWKWGSVMGESLHGEDKYDTKMFFLVENMPTLNGELTSRLASLLPDWYRLGALKAHNNAIVRRIAQPQHIIEYHPNVASMLNAKDQDYVDQRGRRHPSSFFPNVTVGQDPPDAGRTPAERIQKGLGAISEFRRDMGLTSSPAPSQQGRIAAGLDPHRAVFANGNDAVMDQDTEAADKLSLFLSNNPDVASRLHLSKKQLPNSVPLDPFEKYVPVHVPSATIIEEVTREEMNFNRLVGTVLNSPLSLLLGSDTKTPSANVISQEGLTHNRERSRIKFFCGLIKQVFKLAFLSMFERARSDIQRLLKYHIQNNLSIEKIIAIEKALDFSVVFKPANTPLAFEDIIQLYQNAVIDENTAYNMFHSKIGLTDPPLEASKEFKKRMKELYRQPPELMQPQTQQPQKTQETDASKKRKRDESATAKELDKNKAKQKKQKTDDK